VRVALDWTLDLFFARDIVLLKLFIRPDLRQVREFHPEMEIETETTSPIMGTPVF
jgi:hypothetical protein